jgi:hypothetical protein
MATRKVEEPELDLSEAREKEEIAERAKAAKAALAETPDGPPPETESAPASRAEARVAEQTKALERPSTEMQGRLAKASLVVGGRGLTLGTFAEMWRFADCVVQSRLFSYIKTPQQAIIAIEMGAEVGVGPIQALQNIAVINDRACMWGDILLGLVFSSTLLRAIEEKVEGEGDDRIGHCTVHRRGFEAPTHRAFTWREATLAGLTKKDNWVKYPRRMLQMRARGFALRDLFPDVLKGMVTREEAEDMVIEGHIVEPLAATDRQRFGLNGGPPPGAD